MAAVGSAACADPACRVEGFATACIRGIEQQSSVCKNVAFRLVDL